MKKIFRGRRYDTDTAKQVGYASNSDASYVHFWEEKLYRKNTGEFFLHGSGGALSKYREQASQGSWRGGEKIIPLTLEQAQQWAEENLDVDEYEKIFGAVEEDGEKRAVSMSLDKGTVEKLKREAVRRGCSVSALVEDLAKKI